MPGEAFAWGTRIKAVEREYVIARLGMDRLDQHTRDNPPLFRLCAAEADLQYRSAADDLQQYQ